MCKIGMKLDWFQIGFGVKLFLKKSEIEHETISLASSKT
jgi:hypothetical protein